MNFLTASGISTENLQRLEENLRQSVIEDEFIKKSCTPLIQGGKRLRPMLFLLCANSREKISVEKILPLAVALELIHTASLVHDDILDSSKKRRGIETSNSKYGAQIAVLIGDYLFAKAFQLVAEGNYGDEVALILSKLVKNLCRGEIMQDLSLFKIPTLDEYYERINLKTAIFLSTCCRLGGIVSGLNRTEVDGLTNYGNSLGIAFQIVDDLLDFFGEEKITGKSLGSDLKSGVITLPVIRTLQVSNDKNILREIINKKNVAQEEINSAVKIVRATDAFTYCKLRAKAHIESAGISLPQIKKSVKLALEQAADFVVMRNF
ncbi:MAG: polyprenyl synthetase family protein [Selenomonadaceae bacterium]|nr:polyprenyl synthetase family protein [Selenomonadaceae bacterium]